MSIGDGVCCKPARDFGEAERRFVALRALDGPSIAPAGYSRFFGSGKRTPLAVVLLHGLTNAPQQWVPFAELLARAGHNVVVPRLPGHGESNRQTTAIARVTANELLATASGALDIACGAGERVVVAGLSIGGSMAAWLALRRMDVARAVAIVPLFGLRGFPLFADRTIGAALATLPNVFVPWDPKGHGAQIPAYGYPRFPTRLLAGTLRIGLAVERIARERVPAGSVTMLLNASEPAVQNTLAQTIARRFEAARPGCARTVVWSDLPAIHDIIDPTNPFARTDLVYPRLRAEIER